MTPAKSIVHAPNCASTAMCLLSGDQTAALGQWRSLSARLTLMVVSVVAGLLRCQGNQPCHAAPTTEINTTAVTAISAIGTRRRDDGLVAGEHCGSTTEEASVPTSSRIAAIRWLRK